MVEPIFVTILPVLFLILLFGGGVLLRRRGIDMDGEPPIDRRPYYVSKYSILILWAAMIMQSWGVDLSFVEIPKLLKWFALCLWVGGFALLLVGRLGLGSSFRVGSARESTRLTVGGLFRLSRNPMYLGMYRHTGRFRGLLRESDPASPRAFHNRRSPRNREGRRTPPARGVRSGLRRLSRARQEVLVKVPNRN